MKTVCILIALVSVNSCALNGPYKIWDARLTFDTPEHCETARKQLQAESSTRVTYVCTEGVVEKQ